MRQVDTLVLGVIGCLMVRIGGFDGLRACAVLAVFANHRVLPLHKFTFGQTGVLVFFALSGFLIVGSLHLDRLAIERGDLSVAAALRSFLRRRTLRIFPIYYLLLGGLAILALSGANAPGWSWDAAPWRFLYLSNVYEGLLGRWSGQLSHLWTLAIEEQFYLIAAPALLLLPARHHLKTCALVVVIGLGSLSAHLALGFGLATHTDSFLNFAFLAFGGALRVGMDGRRLPLAEPACWLASLTLLALAFIRADATGPLLEVRHVVSPFVAGLLVLAVARAQGSVLVALLELPPLVWLGRISYGFYLYHALLPEPPIAWPLAAAVSLLATVTIAWASYRFIEAPLIRLGRPQTVVGKKPAAA